jgi:hypothetical protein
MDSLSISTNQLLISNKFYSKTDFFALGYQVAFHNKKNKLCLKRAVQITPDHTTNLSDIVTHINQLQKPIFKSLANFRNLFQKLKQINSLIGSNQPKINLIAFNNNLQPEANEIRERLWAVHATSVIPQDSELKVFNSIMNDKPLVFRKEEVGVSRTLHFAIGELVRPHGKTQTWDYVPFAILVPFGVLLDTAKVINIFTYDTMVLGNWKIPVSAILIVPEEMVQVATANYPFKIVTYPTAHMTLREAVSREILQQKGIQVSMTNRVCGLGARAFIDGEININSMSFFNSIFTANSDLSFGDASHSLRGRAESLGHIRLITSDIHQLSTNFPRIKAPFLQMHILIHIKGCAVILQHHLERAQGYLTLADQDKIKGYISRCESVFSLSQQNLPYKLQARLFHHLSYPELRIYQLQHPEIFKTCYNEFEFETLWALSRWLFLGLTKAKIEQLEVLYNALMEAWIKTKPKKISAEFVSLMNDYLEEDSKTSETMLYILRLESTRRYLQTVTDSPLKLNYGAATVREVLQSHVKLGYLCVGDKHILQETIDRYSREKPEQMHLILRWRFIPLETNLNKMRSSFSALEEADEFIQSLDEQISSLHVPLMLGDDNEDTDMVMQGTETLQFYKKHFRSPAQMWKLLGLEKEFGLLFNNEDEVWNSGMSFMTIYNILRMPSFKI